MPGLFGSRVMRYPASHSIDIDSYNRILDVLRVEGNNYKVDTFKDDEMGIYLSRLHLGILDQEKQPIIFGEGNIIRDYIHINDVAEVNLMALSKKSEHRVFNVGSGEGTSLNDLINMMSIVVGKTLTPKYVNVRKGDISEIVLYITRIKKEYGWEPKTSMIEGIRDTWSGIKNGEERC